MFIVMLGITRELYETLDTLIFIITTLNTFGQNQPEMNVIYIDQHFFTIAPPEGWINDKGAASKIGHTHPIFD